MSSMGGLIYKWMHRLRFPRLDRTVNWIMFVNLVIFHSWMIERLEIFKKNHTVIDNGVPFLEYACWTLKII